MKTQTREISFDIINAAAGVEIRTTDPRVNTLVGNSNDPPSEKCREPQLHYTIYHCILGNKLVKTGQNWSKLVKLFKTGHIK